MQMLAIIPARGGSVGVPRKNLQPINGVPLVIWKARQVAQLRQVERLVVSTEDPLIASVVQSHGFEVHWREKSLSTADVTLAQVAAAVAFELDWEHEIGLFQATCPTLSVPTMQAAIDHFEADLDLGSLVTAVEEHGNVANGAGYLRPLVNRQFRQEHDELWRATGGVTLVRNANLLECEGVNAPPHYMFEVSEEEGIDVDTPADLVAARAFTSRLTIQLVALAHEGFGTGHVRRCLALADELAFHDVHITLCGEGGGPCVSGEWALPELRAAGYDLSYPVLPPDLVVLDTLGADPYIGKRALPVISLEDLSTDRVTINELYTTGTYAGPSWAVLRPEFLALPAKDVASTPETVGVLMGGHDYHSMWASVQYLLTTQGSYLPLTLLRLEDFGSVAEYMRASDILICGRGRTMYEAAAVGVPTITIPQNYRETTHVAPPWAVNLDMWSMLREEQLYAALKGLRKDQNLRQDLARLGRATVDGLGASRIRRLIEGTAVTL